MSRSALVTGGGTGIGRGIALALARRGVQVALVGRRLAPLQAVAREVEALGGRALVLAADLALAGERAGLLERVHATLGPVDLLVNCAGVLAGGTLGSLTSQQIERAIGVNLIAPIELTRQALPDLRSGHGAVVLVGSSMSFVPLPSASIYAAGKAGLRAFGEALRYELAASGVHLLVVSPPATGTALVTGMKEAAGFPHYPLAAPEVVGERIIQALLSGRRELLWGLPERLLIYGHRFAPWAIRAVLRVQRRRFDRMMTAWNGRVDA